MKQRRFPLIMTVLLCVCVSAYSQGINNYDFSYRIGTGHNQNTIYLKYSDVTSTPKKVILVAKYYDNTSSEYHNAANELQGSVILPDTIVHEQSQCVIDSIAGMAFIDDSNISSITIPASVRAIGNYAFFNCSNLDSIFLSEPDNLATIEEGAFYSCINLKHIDRMTAIKSILDFTFYGSRIDSVHVPSTVTEISGNAFSGMAYLKDIDVSSHNAHFSSHNGILYDKTATTLLRCPAKKNGSVADLPANLSGIAQKAFQSCKDIDTIILPPSVKKIGSAAFDSCVAVRHIHLGGVDSLDITAFQATLLLDTLSADASSNYYNCEHGVLYQSDTLVLYPQGRMNSSFSIPAGIVKIGDNAFCGNRFLQGYTTQGGNLKEIGKFAFSSCTALHSAALPSTINQIGSNAFEGCHSLRETDGSPNVLVLPNSMTKIDDYTFAGCSSLQNIMLGSNTSHIGYYAFSGDTNISGTLTIPDSVRTIKPYAFQDCRNLHKIGFNAINCNEAGDSSRYAFAGCTGIDTIDIAKNVTKIVRYTFAGCSNINTINMYPTSIPYVDTMAFETSNSTVNLNVPCGVGYNTSYYWKNFNINRVEFYPLAITANDPSLGTVSYDCNTGVLSANIRPEKAALSYKFVYWSDGGLDSVRTYIPNSTDTTRLTAIFSLEHGIPVRVLINDNTRGSVSGGGTYNPQDAVVISATPNTHYHFARWNDGDLNNPRTIIVTGTTTLSYTAIIEPDIHTITKTAENGTILQDGASIYGNKVTLTAVPDRHYHFKYWQDGNIQNPREVTIFQDTAITAIFAPDTFRIDVYSADILLGSASGSGKFAYGFADTLHTDAEAHHHFVRWSDGNTDSPRHITVNNDSVFVAIFAIDTHTVNTSVNDAAMGSVISQNEVQYAGITTMEAVANHGYLFSHWNDGSTSPIRTVTVTKDTSFTAYFVTDTFRIDALSNNTAKGSVSGSGDYLFNTEITLVATANPHYHFIGWSNGVTDNPYTFNVSNDSVIVAQFLGDTIEVTLNSNDNSMGRIYGSGTYFYGDTVILNPRANTGHHFLYWNDGITVANRNVTLSQDTSFTAYFAIDTLQISVLSNDTMGGLVSGGGTFLYHQQTQLSATPKPHYHFLSWSDGNSDNPRDFTALKDTTIHALFYIDTHNVSLSCNNNFYGSLAGAGDYPYGYSLNISANPYPGYHFMYWNDGLDSASRTISVLKDTTLEATFAIDTYYINLQPNNIDRGTVSGTGNYIFNTQVTISATAFPHYNFVNWSDGNTSNPRTFPATSNRTLSANFVGDNHTVNILTNDISMGNAQRFLAHYADTLFITPQPNTGHHFAHWDDGTTTIPRRIAVDSDITITAIYAVDTFHVNLVISDTSAGTLHGTGLYTYGSADTLVAIPNNHYGFMGWNDGVTDSIRIISVYSDTTLTAYFEGDPMTITVRTSNVVYGTVRGSGTFAYASMDTIYAIPNPHHHFLQWADGNTDNPRIIKVLQDSVFTADFSVDTHFINVVSADTNQGTIDGTGYYNYGTTTHIAAYAKPYHRFVQWSDGNTQNPRLVVVIRNETYTAEFETDSTNTPDGLSLANENITLHIYPNPTDGMVYFDTESEIDKVEIMDAVGRVVASDTGVRSMDLSAMAQGIYTIRFTFSADKVMMKRIVVR